MVNPNHSMIFRFFRLNPAGISEIDGYAHRTGRCGRAGRMGTAVTFVGGLVWGWFLMVTGDLPNLVMTNIASGLP